MKSIAFGNAGFNLRRPPATHYLLASGPLKYAALNHLFMGSETGDGVRSDIMNVEIRLVAPAILG